MRFGGIQKTSFIDFPNKISCVLFLSGCNFTCPYCQNPALARGEFPQPLPEEEIYGFLSQRRNFLEGVVLSGGEPTLCNDIYKICRRIKSLGYSLKLDTNGSRPNTLKRLFKEDLIDYVAMDVKTDPAAYGPPLTSVNIGPQVIDSINLLLADRVPYEFRTTCVAPFISPAIITRIGFWIKGARRYFLQPFRSDRILWPDFFSDIADTISDLEALKTVISDLVPGCQVRR